MTGIAADRRENRRAELNVHSVIDLNKIRSVFIVLCLLLSGVSGSALAQQNSLHFDGVDDYVDLGRPGYLSISQTSDFTWEGWIKNTGTTHQTLLSNMWDDESERGFDVYIKDGQLRLMLSSVRSRNEYTEVSTTARVNTGNWTHVAVSFTGMPNNYTDYGVAANVRFYINGTPQPVNVLRDNLISSFPIWSNQNVIIGVRNGMHHPFNGEIDEMRWWSSVRSASEIAASLTSKCSIQTYDENLRLNFDFNQGTGGANNAGVATLPNHGSVSANGTLVNFALNGTSSNWQDASANGIFPNCATVNVRFVKPGAPDGGSGLTWDRPYKTLQAALEQVLSEDPATPAVTEIWVAKGTYYPDEWTGFDNNRNGYFKMRNNLGIYGGFAGTETTRGQRNPTANPTILSGEIQQDGNSTNNSYYVVANINNSLNNTAVLDGFTITGGYNQTGTGAGMHNEGSSPTVRNCYFMGNTALNGGAVGNSGNAAPNIGNCVFTGNIAYSLGGAMANQTNAAATIANCTFYGNAAGSGGGSVFNQNDYTSIYNSIFWGNGNSPIIGNSTNSVVAYSIVQGGYSGSSNLNKDPFLVNADGGNLSLLPCSPAINTGNNSYVSTEVTSDIAGNPRRYANGVVDMGAYEYQGETGVGLPSAPSPQALATNATVADLTATGSNIEWFETTNGTALSPSRQLFSGTYYVRQSLGGCVGPFLPVQVNLYSNIAYIKPIATGRGDGSSWSNASNDIQAMINKAGIQELWVEAGTYKPSTIANGGYNQHDMTFVLKEGIRLYGGFAGTETQLSQRSWETHKTILSGDIGVQGDSTDNVGHIVVIVGSPDNPITSATVLDGFTLTGGNTNNSYSLDINGQIVYNYGGGVFNMYASPTLSNLVISRNTSYYYGGGMYNEQASPLLNNVTISQNWAYHGGGMCNDEHSVPVITNSSVTENYAQGDGGGVYNYYYSSPVITNSWITGNRSDNEGGGIYNYYYSSPVITNGWITGNRSEDEGGGIYNYHYSSPVITNSSVSDNYSDDDGGGIYLGFSSTAEITGSLINGNRAGADGGGIYNDSELPLSLDRVTLSGNIAGEGGAIYNEYKGVLDIKNTLIAGNMAEKGGGIYNSDGLSMVLTNLTMSGNRNYAIYNDNYPETTVAIKNSVIYGNENGVRKGTATISLSNSLVEGESGNDGNLDGSRNPLFVNAPVYTGAPFTGGDYTVMSCSPVVNAGSDADNATSTDLGGNNRRFGGIDIGAFELQTVATNIALSADNHQITNALLVNGIADFVENCNLLVSLSSVGDRPVSGEVTAKVWVDDSQHAQYVSRHYEITPTVDASAATGRVTLYFTQQEFDGFNTVNTHMLPDGPGDQDGIARLLIEKRGGGSNDGSGIPGSYSGTTQTINPADDDIVWNSAASHWEVSFDVTGFSGFFVKTTESALPVRWISFEGKLNDQHHAVLDWKVDQTSVSGYRIERSSNARDFRIVGTVAAKHDGIHQYSFTDPVAVAGTVYYRIRQVDQDGTFSYSRILSVSGDERIELKLYPNPVRERVTVQVGSGYVGSRLKLMNISGAVLGEITVIQPTFVLDMAPYAPGAYLLSTEDGKIIKLIRY
jgi:hypothetical protein